MYVWYVLLNSTYLLTYLKGWWPRRVVDALTLAFFAQFPTLFRSPTSGFAHLRSAHARALGLNVAECRPSGVLGVYAVYLQPPVFFTAYTHLSDHK